MPSQALSVRLTGINGASNGIDGCVGCNFIYFSDKIQLLSTSGNSNPRGMKDPFELTDGHHLMYQNFILPNSWKLNKN